MFGQNGCKLLNKLLSIYSGLKFKCCENLKNIGTVAFAISLGPHNRNDYNKSDLM